MNRSALPRIVIAAPASGHGKTTIATGLMAALRSAGHRVSGHKVGPDFIDPGYHSLATGLPGRNLDAHLVGVDKLAPLLLHGAADAEIAVIEGVMGLYDGMIGGSGFASTAHVAKVLDAPVVLVVDISHASRSIAAVVQGLAGFDTAVRIAGVILNKAGSERHAGEVISALEETGIEVLGVLGRDDGIVAPSRHLGLVPAAERPEAQAALATLADKIAERIDLDKILEIARSAPGLAAESWDPAVAMAADARPLGEDSPVVAIAGGRSFTFRYAETEELLRAAGCRTVIFDPMRDDALPKGTAGIYLGGGFPEVHASALSGNELLRRQIRDAIASGVPTVAECAGLLYLCQDVDGAPMVGALDASGAMSPRLTLSYRTAIAAADSLLAVAGTRVTGHEFHRTVVSTTGTAPAWLLDGRPDGFSADPAGLGRPTLHASYLHTHWAGWPELAARFVAAVREATPIAPAAARPAVNAPVSRETTVAPIDLGHHGDREVGNGLVDFAVNVRRGGRPEWLERALAESMAGLAAYPNDAAAREAIAARHVRRPAEVLPTSGGAEAFTLIARARAWRRPVVVHPQFTEPEAALLAAGHRVERVLLRPEDRFGLAGVEIPADADLLMLGNPTNPTGVLHAAADLLGLLRPGRVVVVDEAFMDVVPGETQSLISRRLPGLIVVRSLTKTWSLAGLRAGYVVAEPELISELAAQQPPWSVSGPAAAAMIACMSPDASAEAARIARSIIAERAVLADGLAELGLPVAGGLAAPFVLVQVPTGLREALREIGFAVRRGDTFPGLGPEWIRIAVRDAASSRGLCAAISSVLGSR
ncbi:cobyrinate a,c-diamide synthase [Tomitella biformata]|uniref:cobyrinate a,c-diamide synthase n=1 Tax=Tomitella biformata TaxID=630403 RepID=UPI0004B4A279|nr:cobyrinate a,c-diamide synthase [Tomitella biformata]